MFFILGIPCKLEASGESVGLFPGQEGNSEAGHLKHSSAPFRQWLLMGAYSLILINAGIAFFGKAIVFQVQYQYRRETRRKLKRMEKMWTAALKKKNAAQGGKNS